MRDRAQVIAEIQKLSREYKVPILIFENEACVKELLDDMRVGANIKAGLKRLNLPCEPEPLM